MPRKQQRRRDKAPDGLAPAWVARGPLAELLDEYFAQPEAMSRRQLEHATRTLDPDGRGVSRRMIRKITDGEVQWVRLETADRLLGATGQNLALDDMDVFVAG